MAIVIKKRVDQRGITLMETVVVVGVMAILFVMVAQIFVSSFDLYAKQAARTENNTSAVLAGRTISQMTRGASQVMATQTINGTDYTTSDLALVLEMPSVNSSDEIIDGSFDYIAIYRDGTDPTLIHSDTEAAVGSVRLTGTRLVTKNNEALIFRFNDKEVDQADRVSIYLVNKKVARGVDLYTQGWTSIFLRNF